MTHLPVGTMVLYRRMLGFFVREGAVEGNSLAPTFWQEEINDVLNSLDVLDRVGGQVLDKLEVAQTRLDSMDGEEEALRQKFANYETRIEAISAALG